MLQIFQFMSGRFILKNAYKWCLFNLDIDCHIFYGLLALKIYFKRFCVFYIWYEWLYWYSESILTESYDPIPWVTNHRYPFLSNNRLPRITTNMFSCICPCLSFFWSRSTCFYQLRRWVNSESTPSSQRVIMSQKVVRWADTREQRPAAFNPKHSQLFLPERLREKHGEEKVGVLGSPKWLEKGRSDQKVGLVRGEKWCLLF